MNKEVYILGIGGSSPLFIDLAEACGYTIKGLFHYNDSRTGEIDHGYKILGSFEDLYKKNIHDVNFMLSMGDMQIRKQVSEKILSFGGNIPSMIHPSAQISRFAEISKIGVLIGAGCIIQADSNISAHTVIRDMALVCHQTTINEYCFIGPKSLVGAHTTLKNFSFVGQGAILISGKVIEVGENAIIGAGSVVTRPVSENTTVIGSPAKPKG
jgi:UDP-perosamine 4-acetyltransferase